MYIKSANIYGFGKLVDQKFDFQQDYQVIRGFNESGKTTLLAFIKAILFEFESAKSTDEQYIPKNASQYGGELVLVEAGSEWLIRRVKGKKVAGDVTVYKDGTEFPESALKDLLKNVDKDMYNSAYILNQKNLGTFDKLDRDKLIEDILTVGAVGGTEWLDLVKQLDSDAGDIYRVSKNAKKPMNLALREYNDLVQQQASMQDQKAEYVAKNQELDILADETAQVGKQRDKMFNDFTKQRALLDKKAEYLEYLELNEALKQSQQQIITNDDWDKFKATDEQIKALKANLENAQASITKLSDNEELVLNNYVSNQEQINQLHSNLSDISRQEFNLEQLQSEITTGNNEKQNILMSNTKLSENMTPLTTEELTAVNNAIKQRATAKKIPNSYIAIGAGVVTIAGLFLPGAWKAVSAVGSVITAWFWYRSIAQNKESDTKIVDDYLIKHNYRDLTLDEAVMWQPQIAQLQTVINKLDLATDNYTAGQRELAAWSKQVNDLNIVSEVSVKQVNAYFEQLNYLQKKQADIQAATAQMSIKTNELSQQLMALNQQQTDLVTKYQVPTVTDFTKKRTQDLASQEQIKRRDVLQESLDTELLAKIDDNPNEFDRVTNELNLKQEQLNELNRALNDKQAQLAQLQVEINNLANDDDYLRLEKAINDKQTEIIDYYDDWVAQKLGSVWVYDTLNLASSNRFPKMLNRTQKYFNILTTGKYVGVEFEETIIVQSVDSQKFELHELSTGTIAQLFIALRCAFVMEISDLVKLPILIDDAFNDFDKERYEAAANLVKSMSEENQIFYVMNNNIPADYFDVSHIIDLGGKND